MSNPTTRVAFHTMGCKTNFSETSIISREMMAHGLQKVRFIDKADVYVLKSCSVTENFEPTPEGTPSSAGATLGIKQ